MALGISLIALRAFAHPIDLNTIAEDRLAAILRTNGVSSTLIHSLLSWRQKNGWIWSYEELLLCGVPEESLSWFRYHFILPPPLPPEESSSDLADFLLYPVDLNSASSSALSLLPGMDEGKVKKILAYRQKKGFGSPRDLLSLGWTQEEIQRLAPFITISPLPNHTRWSHSLRIEGSNLLYRSTLTLPSFEAYLLLPEPQKTTGNLSTIQTQAIMGAFFSPSWGKIIIGDLVYRQGAGLVSGNTFSIISRYPSEMIPWEKGLSRPYSAKRDQNNNRYDEILRGIGLETWWKIFSLGGILSSNQLVLGGGWLAIGSSETKIGIQGFQTLATNTPLSMGSVFGKVTFQKIETGGEIASSKGHAWIGWLRRRGKLSFAGVFYHGETNFFSPLSGELYRGITGKSGLLVSLFANFRPWETLLRGEWYTNQQTSYTTLKVGGEGAYAQTIGNERVSLRRIAIPLSFDYRTNQLFSSEGLSLEGKLFDTFFWETKVRLHHHQHQWGNEYHLRTSLGQEKWYITLWYSWLSPLEGNPISLTFPPIESQEMESLWFYEKTEVWCFLVRYRRKEFSVATRLLLYEKKSRFALSLQWQW